MRRLATACSVVVAAALAGALDAHATTLAPPVDGAAGTVGVVPAITESVAQDAVGTAGTATEAVAPLVEGADAAAQTAQQAAGQTAQVVEQAAAGAQVAVETARTVVDATATSAAATVEETAPAAATVERLAPAVEEVAARDLAARTVTATDAAAERGSAEAVRGGSLPASPDAAPRSADHTPAPAKRAVPSLVLRDSAPSSVAPLRHPLSRSAAPDAGDAAGAQEQAPLAPPRLPGVDLLVGPAGASTGGNGFSLFAALIAALVLAAPAVGRRLRPPPRLRPSPVVLPLLERPG